MKFLLLLLLSASALAAPPANMRTDSLRLGIPTNTTADKIVEFNNGSGATNPKIKYNGTGTKFQYSNDGSTFVDFGTVPNGDSASTVTNYALATTLPGSNALNVALQTKAGSNPSVGSPVTMDFRHTTATTGTYLSASVTAALSVTAVSGASFGTTSAIVQYLYVYAQYNSGTPEMCLAGGRYFDEGSLQTTTTIGAGSTSGTVLYCTTGRSSQPIRFLGRIQVTESTAGTYASNATEVSTYTSNIPQQKQLVVGAYVGGTGTASTTSYANFVSSPISITFTATATARYKVWYNPYCESSGANVLGKVKVTATSGSPTIVVESNAVTPLTLSATMFTYGIYALTAGTSYTFNGQGKVASGTMNCYFGYSDIGPGNALIAEQME